LPQTPIPRLIHRVNKLLLYAAIPFLRRLHTPRPEIGRPQHRQDVANAWSVARDVRVACPDVDSGRVVLPAEDMLHPKVGEDCRLDTLLNCTSRLWLIEPAGLFEMASNPSILPLALGYFLFNRYTWTKRYKLTTPSTSLLTSVMMEAKSVSG